MGHDGLPDFVVGLLEVKQPNPPLSTVVELDKDGISQLWEQ